MVVGMAGQQQEEIETIRSRTIEVKLSDADVKRISEKAAAHGLTVGELIENFIGDLVCGTYGFCSMKNGLPAIRRNQLVNLPNKEKNRDNCKSIDC